MDHVGLQNLVDDLHQRWREGRPLPSRLESFRSCYTATGRYAPVFDAMPEPFIGNINAARAITVAINPGPVAPEFQLPGGLWAGQIEREYGGSYTAWAATSPYTSPAWTAVRGKVQNVEKRIAFASGWVGDELEPSEVLFMELYWWHSHNWHAGRYRADPRIENDLLWGPASSLGIDWVFLFGRPLVDAMDANPSISVLERIPPGTIESTSKTRHWTIGRHESGVHLVGMVAANNLIAPPDEAVALRGFIGVA